MSGRINDYDGYLQHFEREQEVLEGLGHEAINPCLLGEETFTYAEFMRCDIRALLDCDAMYMLNGWELSAGARCEHLVGSMSGLSIYYEASNPLNFSA